MPSLLDVHLNVRESQRILENTYLVEKALRATRRWSADPAACQVLQHMLGAEGTPGTPALSNSRMRSRSCRLLADCLRAYWEENLPPDQQGYFLTLSSELGFTSDGSPVLHCRNFKRYVTDAIRDMGLSSVGQLELQAVVNWNKGKGRTLMLHAHAVGWGDVSPEEVKEVIAELSAMPRWTNPFGADPIVADELEGGMAGALLLAYYIDKLPTSGKNLMKRRKNPERMLMRDTQAGYRPELALRVLEGLSQISIFDAAFATGDGAIVRRAWKSELKEWLRQNRADEPVPLECAGEVWRCLREGNGSKRFQPFQVH